MTRTGLLLKLRQNALIRVKTVERTFVDRERGLVERKRPCWRGAPSGAVIGGSASVCISWDVFYYSPLIRKQTARPANFNVNC